MRLFSSKIPVIAKEIVDALTADGDIEVNEHAEAELDIQSVLKEYLRTDRELTERAKDLMDSRGLAREQFGKIKRSVAEEKGFGLGEDAINWICNQTLEIFMQSRFIEEIFASDVDLRKKMKTVIKKHMMVDEELDAEVRQRIRNLQEGTSQWEVEYSKVSEQMKAKRGIKD